MKAEHIELLRAEWPGDWKVNATWARKYIAWEAGEEMVHVEHRDNGWLALYEFDFGAKYDFLEVSGAASPAEAREALRAKIGLARKALEAVENAL